jgi:hypothetical protein
MCRFDSGSEKKMPELHDLLRGQILLPWPVEYDSLIVDGDVKRIVGALDDSAKRLQQVDDLAPLDVVVHRVLEQHP